MSGPLMRIEFHDEFPDLEGKRRFALFWKEEEGRDRAQEFHADPKPYFERHPELRRGRCCDPMEIGCIRPLAVGFALRKTPHNVTRAQPCQACRVRRARKQRGEAGKRPVRSGAGTQGRL